MKVDITDVHFVELHKKGYTVDMVVMLGWIHKNLSVEHIIKESKRIEAIYQSMIRKKLITDEGEITKIGIEILDFVSKKTNKSFIKPKPKQTDFDEWWAIYPTTDEFQYRGKNFGKTRALRIDPNKCRLYFDKLIIEGKYTKEEIVNATLYDVEMRKKNSFKKGQNQLTFLQNSATYLNQESFEPFIKFGKPKIESNKAPLGTVDI